MLDLGLTRSESDVLIRTINKRKGIIIMLKVNVINNAAWYYNYAYFI